MDRLFEVEALGEPAEGRDLRSAVGRATEHLVIARLLESGHRVALPVVDDDGVDLIVDYRLTVQVKSSQLAEISPDGRCIYRFHVFTNPRSDWQADLFVFRGYDPGSEDVWWVVPGAVLRGLGAKSSVSLQACGNGRWSRELLQYRDAWGLFDAAD